MLYIRQNQLLQGLCPTILCYAIKIPPQKNNPPQTYQTKNTTLPKITPTNKTPTFMGT